jgi:energy-converting hydrogenase Eha subunit G
MEWARDPFFDLRIENGEYVRTKPVDGPRRALADLVSCPWCVGLWFALFVAFFYFLTPFAWFPILFLAIAGVASILQVSANIIGWSAEGLKKHVERL